VHLGIKAKQIGGMSLIVGLAVGVLSLVHFISLTRVSLEESRKRGELLAYAIFQRAQAVVPGQADPYAALRTDGGVRSILESSAYSKELTYAAICKVDGESVADSDPDREGRQLPPAGNLDDLLSRPGLAQLVSVYRSGGRNLEVRQPLTLGGEQFGAIRIGVSTLLVRDELTKALKPAAATAFVAMLLGVFVAASFARLILRPIHVIRSGLNRLGQGEFGVRLDLPQKDEFGELGNFFNTVSAQLSADRSQLAGEKAHLESAVEHMEDEVAIFNPGGELLFANPAMRAVLPGDPVGRPIDDVLPADHPYRGLVLATLRDGQSSGPVQARAGAANDGSDAADGGPDAADAGTERLAMAHAIKDRDQRLVGVMLVARNVEYLGRVQSMLNYSRKLMALGRLSAGVAHEVKNPLNAMTIHLELLKQKLMSGARAGAREPAREGVVSLADRGLRLQPDGPQPEAAASDAAAATLGPALDHVKIIGGEIRRLDEVMQGFLKFTRTEDLKLQAIPLRSLVEEVVKVVEPECGQAGVTIRIEGFDALPDINGDPTMLRQAFLNLALNACQAMPNGGTLRIAARRADPRRVELAFEDTGMGIKPEHLGRIFDLYFTTRAGGSGIGLSMVFRTVQLHDGEIEVQSIEGRGTTFRLLLPRA
jgi:signal transduction histidine kinase